MVLMVIVLLIGSFEAAKTIHGQVSCTEKSRLLMDKLDESGMENLRAWVRNRGTMIPQIIILYR